MVDPPATQQPAKSAPADLSSAWVWVLVPFVAAVATFIAWRAGKLAEPSGRQFVLYVTGIAVAFIAAAHVFHTLVKPEKRTEALWAIVFTLFSIFMIAGLIASYFLSDPVPTPMGDNARALFMMLAVFSMMIACYGEWLDLKWAAKYKFAASVFFVLLIASVFLHEPGQAINIGPRFLQSPASAGFKLVVPFLWLGAGLWIFIVGLRDPESQETIIADPIIILAWPFLLVLKSLGFVIILGVPLAVIYGISYAGYLLGHSRLITAGAVGVLVGVGIFLRAGKSESKGLSNDDGEGNR